MVALVLLVAGCRSPKQIMVEVPVHDTTYMNHVDSVLVHDSVYVERETIVREADSAMLAEYGLKLQDNERTILVLRRELLRREHSEASKQADTVDRYVEKPVTVTKYIPVEKALTWWQKLQMWTGRISILALVGYVGWRIGLLQKIYKLIRAWIKR